MEEEEQTEEPAKVGHLDHSNRKKKVGNYLLGNIIGEGLFAKVRQGLHIIAREKVAVKIVTKKAVLLRDVVKRSVRREAVLLQRLDHVNIVRLYEIMETENSYYLVLELAEAGDFIKYLSKQKVLAEKEVQKYISQIASALDHMHASNILHRDLKLENLLLDKDHNIKIIDFGLGNVFYGDSSLNTQCGSPVYAAPEMFCHNHYGPGVDIWSMGICMYAMLQGRLPFPPDQADNLALLQATILRGARIPDDLTPECEDLLSRLLAVNVADRISVDGVLAHSFLVDNPQTNAIKKQPPVAKLHPVVPKATVVNYMTTVFNFIEDEIFYSVIERKMNAVAATYHLLQKRFDAGLHLLGSSLVTGSLRASGVGKRGDNVVGANSKIEKQTVEEVHHEGQNAREIETSTSKSTHKSYLQLLKDSKIRSAQSMRSNNSSNISQKELALRRYKTRPDFVKLNRSREEAPFLPDFVLTYADRDDKIGNNTRQVGKYEWEQSFVITKKDTQKNVHLAKQQKQDLNRPQSVFVAGKEIFGRPPAQTDGDMVHFPNELYAPPSTPATPFIKERPFPRSIASSKYRDIPDDFNEKAAGLSETASMNMDYDVDDIPWPPPHKSRQLPASHETHTMHAKRIKDSAYQYGLNSMKSKPLVSREVKSFFRDIENANVTGHGRKLNDRLRPSGPAGTSATKVEELHSIWSRKSRTANSQRELPVIPVQASVIQRPFSHDFSSRHSDSHGGLLLPEVRGKQIDDMHMYESSKQTVSGGVTDVIRVHITSSNKY